MQQHGGAGLEMLGLGKFANIVAQPRRRSARRSCRPDRAAPSFAHRGRRRMEAGGRAKRVRVPSIRPAIPSPAETRSARNVRGCASRLRPVPVRPGDRENPQAVARPPAAELRRYCADRSSPSPAPPRRSQGSGKARYGRPFRADCRPSLAPDGARTAWLHRRRRPRHAASASASCRRGRPGR